MFKGSLPLSLFTALWSLLACSLQVLCPAGVLLQLWDSVPAPTQLPLCASRTTCSCPLGTANSPHAAAVWNPIYLCVCQVEAVPPGAQGRVSDGPVHLSPGTEGHHARVRVRHSHAAHGSPRRRDGDCQRWALHVPVHGWVIPLTAFPCPVQQILVWSQILSPAVGAALSSHRCDVHGGGLL